MAAAMMFKNMDRVDMEAEHPIVRTHPETGDKGLFVSRGHTTRLKDMTEAESYPLIDFLADNNRCPDFAGFDKPRNRFVHILILGGIQSCQQSLRKANNDQQSCHDIWCQPWHRSRHC